MSQTGNNVRIVNGKIFENSRTKWKEIARAIKDPVEQARQANKVAFTKLQNDAIGQLMANGYTNAEAKKIVGGADASGRAPRPEGAPGLAAPGGKRGVGFASGGRIRGMGSRDTVPLTMGMAAPGELIVNRHTEGRVNSMLGRFGTSLGAEVGGEKVPHSAIPRETNAALGARLPGYKRGGRMSSSIQPAANLATQMGLSVSEGPGYGGIPSSGHHAGSLHYSGLAYDVSGSAGLMRRYFLSALRSFRSSINELFYDPMGYYIDEGQRVGGSIGDHSDHVHIGFFGSGAQGKIRMGGGGRGGRKMNPINLVAPRSGMGGIPGAMADGASRGVARGMEAAINRKIGAGGGRGGSPVPGGSVRGKVSVFGPPTEPGGATASGVSSGEPGIALLQHRTLGKRYRVTVGGHSAILKHTDYGPAAWTGRKIDITGAGAQKMGISPGAFPTDSMGTAQLLAAYGGRMPKFGGWFGNGGRFTADRPTLIGVGERGSEDVQITPKGRGNAGGRGVNIGSIHIENHKDGDITKQVKRELAQAFNELEREIRNDSGSGIA